MATSMVTPAHLRAGDNRLAIDFDAGNASLNRSDDFLYTIFVPARAHEAFPCFDQPDLKARWTLRLDVPSEWQAVGNGAETSRRVEAGRTRVTYMKPAAADLSVRLRRREIPGRRGGA